MNISRQRLFIMFLLVWHYTTTCAGVGKTVAGEGRTGLGHLYQLNQSTVSGWCLHNAIFYAFIMRLTVEERLFILESFLKTNSYVRCRQSFFIAFIFFIFIWMARASKRCYCENSSPSLWSLAFFASVKASSVCIRLSCLVCL